MPTKTRRPTLHEVERYLDRTDHERLETRRLVEDILAYDDGPEVDELIADDAESS